MSREPHDQHHDDHHANPELALLKVLVDAGVVGAEHWSAAQEAIASGKWTAIEWVVRNVHADEDHIAHTVAERLHLPYVSLPTEALNPSVTGLVREDLAAQSGMVPLRAPEGSMVVATANPLNTEARRRLEFTTGRHVHMEVASLTAVRDALQHAYRLDDTLSTFLEGIAEEADVTIAEITEERVDIKGLMRETDRLAKLLKQKRHALGKLIAADRCDTQAADVGRRIG